MRSRTPFLSPFLLCLLLSFFLIHLQSSATFPTSLWLTSPPHLGDRPRLNPPPPPAPAGLPHPRTLQASGQNSPLAILVLIQPWAVSPSSRFPLQWSSLLLSSLPAARLWNDHMVMIFSSCFPNGNFPCMKWASCTVWIRLYVRFLICIVFFAPHNWACPSCVSKCSPHHFVVSIVEFAFPLWQMQISLSAIEGHCFAAACGERFFARTEPDARILFSENELTLSTTTLSLCESHLWLDLWSNVERSWTALLLIMNPTSLNTACRRNKTQPRCFGFIFPQSYLPEIDPRFTE